MKFLNPDAFKNLTAKQLAIYTALIVSTMVLFFFLLYNLLNQFFDNSYLVGISILILVFITNYLIIQLVLKQYIFRRIKLIYKRIQDSKVSMPPQITRENEENMLFEVEQDVEDWATQQEIEIQSLKTLEKYRKRFLGNVSHELKTPIFSIQGYIYTLLDGGLYDEEINEKYLYRAAKNVERVLTIVKDLDEITKLESGELILNVSSFDIKELVNEVFIDMEIPALENETSLIFKEGADKSFNVKGDREYIRQVFNNLIINSIKYGKESGFTKVSFYDMDKHVLVEISDNGIGIEKKHLKHLFDRFYRVDKSRSRSSGGSGLGLSIVKHILEAHNQSIKVRSTPNLGSTFNFTLEKG